MSTASKNIQDISEGERVRHSMELHQALIRNIRSLQVNTIDVMHALMNGTSATEVLAALDTFEQSTENLPPETTNLMQQFRNMTTDWRERNHASNI